MWCLTEGIFITIKKIDCSTITNTNKKKQAEVKANQTRLLSSWLGLGIKTSHQNHMSRGPEMS